MSKNALLDWREARRRSARAAILEAAWSVVGEAGLAGLSMRDLAGHAGTTTPTLYKYFDSKNDIYDAMFEQAAAQFAAFMAAPYESVEPRQMLHSAMKRFVQFCIVDVTRYQLLFQRTIPQFEPSPESYAHAVTALEDARHRLSTIGITEDWQLDMLTALMTGLVDQQISNEPGGDRWVGLIDDAGDMFLMYVQQKGPRQVDRGERASRRPMGETPRSSVHQRS